MHVPFFNYKNFCKDLNYKLLLQEVLETGYLIGGPFVEELENKIQVITGIKHCITVGNATDAMEIIFKFLDLPFNSKVLVPSHTMLATASAAKNANLIPIPVDVDPDSLLLEIKQLEKCDLKGVSACMITQLNGIVADMEPIKDFCDNNKIHLIEDSAQGIGAFNGEKHSGSWGVGGCLSFYPAKVAGGIGDGGAIITNNDKLASFAKSVRDHGRGEEFEAINWGRNSRLDSINARVILERINDLHLLIERRRELASIYDNNLSELEINSYLKLPPRFSTNSNSISTYQNYEIQAKKKDDLIDFLRKNNIGTIKQWGGFSIAHFSRLGYEIEDYPETKALFDRLLLLPMNHMLKKEEIQYICDKINDFYSYD
tara:strand:+ start:147 stop:1262 length:1116 start_codon:yes stop_codon:yes gene_type:complete